MKRRNRFMLWLDAGLLLAVCLLEAKRLTGIPLHEWIGVCTTGTIFVHLLLQWPWIETKARQLLVRGATRTRMNYALNVLLFTTMIVAIVSGIMISQFVVPVARDDMRTYLAWQEVHGTSGHFLMFLVGLHLALNWDWIVAVLQGRLRARPATVARKEKTRMARSGTAVSARVDVMIRRAAILCIAVGVIGGIAYTLNATLVASRIETPQDPTIRQLIAAEMNPRHVNRTNLARLVPDPRYPSLSFGLPAFATTCVVVGVMTLVGRKVLKLRL